MAYLIEPPQKQVQAAPQASKYLIEPPSISKAMLPERSWRDARADAVFSFGVGANQLLKIGGDLYGLATGDMDNYASRQGQSGIEAFSSFKSDPLLASEAAQKKRVAGADGFFDTVATAFGGVMSDPKLLGAFAAEQIPMLTPIGIAGKGAKALTLAAGAGTKTAAKIGTGAAITTGGVMQGADAGEDAYRQAMALPEEAWQANEEYITLLAAGVDQDTAKEQIAIENARRAGGASTGVSILTNMLIPGAKTLEKALGGTGQAVKSRAVETIKGFVGESVQEGIEEGFGKFAANVAADQINLDQDLLAGVAEATGTAMPAGIFGAAAGITSGTDKKIPPKDNIPPEADTADVMRRRSGDLETKRRTDYVQEEDSALIEKYLKMSPDEVGQYNRKIQDRLIDIARDAAERDVQREQAGAYVATQITPETEQETDPLANAPDSAFNGDLEQSLDQIFMSDGYDGSAVSLKNRGFTPEEISALEKAGLATNGEMSKDQWVSWGKERGDRLSGKRKKQTTGQTRPISKPKEYGPTGRETNALPDLSKPEVEPTPEPAAAEKKKPSTQSREGREKLNPDKDSLVVAITKLGGINLEAAREANLDARAARPDVPGYNGIKYFVHRKGHDWDTMREMLVEEGYFPDDQNYNKLLDMLDEEMSGGQKQYSEQLDDQVFADQAEAHYESAQEAYNAGEQGAIDDDADFTPDEIAEMMQEVGIDENIEYREPGDTRQTEQQTDRGDKEMGAEKEDIDTAGTDTGKAEREGREDEFALKQQTAEDIKRQEDARKEAESAADTRQREASARETADKEAGTFELTGSDRVADANAKQSDLAEEVRKAVIKDGGTLFANPLGKIFSMAAGDTEAWAKEMRLNKKLIEGLTKKSHADAPVKIRRSWFRVIFDSSSASMRSQVRQTGSKTADWVLDQFHHEAGKAKVMKEIFESSIERWVTSRLTRFDRLTDKFTDAEMEQMLRQVTSGRINNPESRIGKAAAETKKINQEAFKYLKDNGIDIGEIKIGYMHRQINPAALHEVSKEEFIRDVVKSRIYKNVSSQKARELASALYIKVISGNQSNLTQLTGNKDSFMKGRVFGREVDNPNNPMYKYFDHEARGVMSSYLSAVAKRVEIAKRFGDNFEKWAEIREKIIDEGGANVLEAVEEYVLMATGNRTYNKTKVKLSAFVRSWGSLMLLGHATITSLTEPIVTGMRTGNPIDVLYAYRETLADMFNVTDSAKTRRENAEDLGLVANHLSDNMMIERWAAGDPASIYESRINIGFFRRILLTQLTAGNVVSSVYRGQIFIRRQAKREGRLPDEYLMELGIDKNKLAEFREFVDKDDGWVDFKTLEETEMGQLYASALAIFSRGVLVRPSKTTRPGWMADPFGAVLGQLQSFNYGFLEDVVKRNIRLTGRALSAEEYSAIERVKLVMPMMIVPMLWAASYGLGELRDLSGDELRKLLGTKSNRKEKSTANKWFRAISRGTPIAPIDPAFNLITQSRYDTDTLKMMVGPTMASIFAGADAAHSLMFKNNPDTNAQERKAMGAFWDVLFEPAMNVILGHLPLSPLTFAATQALASYGVKGKVIDETVGEYKGRGGKYANKYKSKYKSKYKNKY